MAWTSPMTFIDGAVLTAAQLNTNLRDNFLETVPAKSTNNGGVGAGYFAVTGPFSLAERGVVYKEVNTAQTTSSTQFTDLATVGPSVSAITSSVALLIMSAEMQNTTGGGTCNVAIELNGKTLKHADESQSLMHASGPDSRNATCQYIFFDDLVPGPNNFTMKYCVGAESGTFRNRRLILLPF